MKKHYQDGDFLVSESYYRTDRFQIVENQPNGYDVWPIGRKNFPFPGYIPLAKFEGINMVNGCELKAMKFDEELADLILREASRNGVKWDKLFHIISDNGETLRWKWKEIEAAGNCPKEIITELHLTFKGIDDWNRPIFKRVDKNQYFGDTDNLFSWGASKEEVMEFYKDRDLNSCLCYFGTSFGCEPSGTSIRKDIKVFVE